MIIGNQTSRYCAEGARHTRVLLISSRHFGWVGLRATLREWAHVRVVGDTTDWRNGVRWAEAYRPDACVVAADVNGNNIIDLVRELRRASARSKVLVVGEEASHEVLEALSELSIEGYLLWSTVRPESLGISLDAVMEEGLCVASRGAVDELLLAPERRRRERDALLSFTERERAVLRGLARGLSERQIADQ